LFATILKCIAECNFHDKIYFAVILYTYRNMILLSHGNSLKNYDIVVLFCMFFVNY